MRDCSVRACTPFTVDLLVSNVADSGKVGGRNDDLIITLQLAVVGAKTFYQSSKYQNFRPVSNVHLEVNPNANHNEVRPFKAARRPGM